MSVSDNYRTYIVEQLSTLPGLSTRRMFGGLGLYSGEWFFALIDDDVLYFKVDDTNREDYTSRRMKVPEDVIEEAEDLTRWARRSVEVAQRAKKRKAPARKK